MGGRGSHSRFAMNPSDGVMMAPQPQEAPEIPDWKAAFDPDSDYESSGDVDHTNRVVSPMLQRRWDAFAAAYQTGVTLADEDAMYKDYDWRADELYGYFRTFNAMEINKALIKNPDKAISDIFKDPDPNNPSERDWRKDINTVNTLDRVVSAHQTQSDAYYLRYCTESSLKRAFGFSDAQMAQIHQIIQARGADATQLKALGATMADSTSFSRGYTSTSANRSMNAFKYGKTRKGQPYSIERRLYVPKGTNAYAPRKNAQESEVLFGRNLHTRFLGMSYEKGHVVIHEMFDGYT